jgi:PAS domain S-box-containing protein
MKQGTDILIVEDEPVQAMKLQYILEQSGYRASVAEGGIEALEAMAAGAPDLVITDINMPGMDGYELCRKIRKSEELLQTPVIILTSQTDPTDVLSGLAAGADSFVTKPYEAESIRTRVKHLLAEGKHPRTKEDDIAVSYRGREYAIGASRFQMLGFFLAMYESLVRQEYELMIAQDELNNVNVNLEHLVEERTAALTTEIAERARAEATVREQATLLDKAQEGIVVCDLQDGITFWNRSAERMFGWTAAESSAMGAKRIFFGEDRAGADSAFALTLSAGEWSGELRLQTKSAATAVIQSSWTLVRDDSGAPDSVLMINTDVTAKKTLEAQMLRNQRMESIGTLAGGIAHDLNNVLAPILLSISLLKKQLPTEKGEALVSMIDTSARRAANMVKQVLTFARGVEGERLLLNPAQITGEIVKMARQSFPRNIEIQVEVPAALGFITGDPTQLHQVLLNVCVNARDAMPQGGVIAIKGSTASVDTQYASMVPDAKPGRYILLSVRDSGTGIAPEILERIFDPFFTTKEVGKGTGLGLSTVLAIVRSHGGFISVKSEPGKGTEFQVFLPASESEGALRAEAESAAVERGNGELILVVDDEHLVRDVTRLTLEGNGYAVLTANDGAEALAVCAEHPRDLRLVLTDVVMPHLDGAGMIRALEKLNPEVKILATSGHAETQSRIEAVSERTVPFILKPYTTEALLSTIHELLREDPVQQPV